MWIVSSTEFTRCLVVEGVSVNLLVSVVLYRRQGSLQDVAVAQVTANEDVVTSWIMRTWSVHGCAGIRR